MAKRRILYGIILSGAIITYFFLADYLSYYLLLFVLCLPPLSFLFLVLNGWHCSIVLAPLESSVSRDSKITVTVSVKGRFRFYVPQIHLCLLLQNQRTGQCRKEQVSFSGNSPHGTLFLSSAFCGHIFMKITKAAVTDPFGLFSFSPNVSVTSSSIFVLPKIQSAAIPDASPSVSSPDSDIFSKEKPGDDPSELFDIRPYREGDRLSRIHFKLSSKYEETMVKEMSLPISVGTLLLLEQNGSTSENERLLDITASLSFSLTQQNFHHRICWSDLNQLKEAVILEEADFAPALFSILSSPGSIPSPRALSFISREDVSRQYERVFYLCGQITPATLEQLYQRFSHGGIWVFLSSSLSESSPLYSLAAAFQIHLMDGERRNPL